MRTRLALLGFSMLTLAACFESMTYGEQLDLLMYTNTEKDLVSMWGPPSRVYELGDDRYLTWRSQNQGFWCETTITVNESQTAVDWRWEGNSCQ